MSDRFVAQALRYLDGCLEPAEQAGFESELTRPERRLELHQLALQALDLQPRAGLRSGFGGPDLDQSGDVLRLTSPSTTPTIPATLPQEEPPLSDVLANVLWKYYGYFKFGFMLLGLWLFIWMMNSGYFTFYSVPPGNSQMAPKLVPREHVFFMDPSIRRQPRLKRGDPVAFSDWAIQRGTDTRFIYVSRVVALGGDTVSSDESGKLMVNGSVVAENEYIPAGSLEPLTLRPMVIPAGYVFLLNDNRGAFKADRKYRNADSRHFGPVPEWCIKGKVGAAFKIKF